MYTERNAPYKPEILVKIGLLIFEQIGSERVENTNLAVCVAKRLNPIVFTMA